MSYVVVLYTDDQGPGEELADFYERSDAILFGEAKVATIKKQWSSLGYLRTENIDEDDEYEILLTDGLDNLLAALYIYTDDGTDYALDY